MLEAKCNLKPACLLEAKGACQGGALIFRASDQTLEHTIRHRVLPETNSFMFVRVLNSFCSVVVATYIWTVPRRRKIWTKKFKALQQAPRSCG